MSKAITTNTTRRDLVTALSAVDAAATIPTGVVAAVAIPAAAPTVVAASDDPIFPLIEDHSAAWKAYTAVIKTECALEDELPLDRRRTSYWWNGETWEANRQNADDDPRWLQVLQDYMLASARLVAAAEALVDTRPTTTAGVIALATYAVAYVRSGEIWPDGWIFDDGGKESSTVTFETFLLHSIAGSLGALS